MPHCNFFAPETKCHFPNFEKFSKVKPRSEEVKKEISKWKYEKNEFKKITISKKKKIKKKNARAHARARVHAGARKEEEEENVKLKNEENKFF